jgi:hypothetical protein
LRNGFLERKNLRNLILEKKSLSIQKELKSYELSTWSSNDDDSIKKHGPLLFFKLHEMEYPMLGGMAKAIFSLMPASTSIECCFSECANIVTTKRNATSTQTLEDLTIIRSHNIFK